MMSLEKRGLALPLLGVALALGFIISMVIFGKTVRKSVPTNQVVKVRGVAEEFIDLDRVEWKITVKVTEWELPTAYKRADGAAKRVTQYLKKKGLDISTVETGGHRQYRQTKRSYTDKKGNFKDEFIGWEVSRTLWIQDAKQLDLVEDVARSIGSELLSKNTPAFPEKPFYFISQDPVELKKRLLEKASANAYFRASLIAKNSRSKLGGLRAARQGDYTGMTYEGRVGGDKRKHRVTSLVTVDYALD